MSRDHRFYLEDMLLSGRKAIRYVCGFTFQQFEGDDVVRDAVLLNLQIIGEAAGHMPDELRERYPEVEWRRLVGLRNLIAHGYFTLNQQIIWDILQQHLPRLVEQFERIIRHESNVQ